MLQKYEYSGEVELHKIIRMEYRVIQLHNLDTKQGTNTNP
jgi:hypothetical protein